MDSYRSQPPYARVLRQSRQLRDLLKRDEIETGTLLHLKAEKLTPRLHDIFHALRQGHLLEAIQIGTTILEQQQVPLVDLQKQLTTLLDKYVTNLENYSPEEAMERIQFEVNDSKIVALAVGKLLLRRQNKKRKAQKRKEKRQHQVTLLVE